MISHIWRRDPYTMPMALMTAAASKMGSTMYHAVQNRPQSTYEAQVPIQMQNDNIPYQWSGVCQQLTYRHSATSDSWDFINSLLLVITLLDETYQFLQTTKHNEIKSFPAFTTTLKWFPYELSPLKSMYDSTNFESWCTGKHENMSFIFKNVGQLAQWLFRSENDKTAASTPDGDLEPSSIVITVHIISCKYNKICHT